MQTALSFHEDAVTNSPWGKLLQEHVPPSSLYQVCLYFRQFPSDLIVTRRRWSKYGDFRPAHGKNNARITVNGDLNPFAFLITLIHEIAHHTCYLRYGNQVKPHGQEWKKEFRDLMEVFVQGHVFPPGILTALYRYMRDPAASSCTDKDLMRALKAHDKKSRLVLLDELPEGALFILGKGRTFRKGPKKRKYYHCLNLKNLHMYLVDPLAEVYPVNQAAEGNEQIKQG